VKIILSDQELLMLKTLGGMRSLVSRAAGVKDAKMGTQSGLEADIDGMIGEYAFCKWKNIFPDLVPWNKSGGADCICNGRKIDIKTTRHKNGRLLATLKNNPDVDTYVLAILDGTEVDFVGWANKTDLCTPENIKNLGHGNGYCLDQGQLKLFPNE